jgi:ATP-dependent exoDNAse (exonuclease V) alpha subunit
MALNKDQTRAFDLFLKGKNVLISGPGGVGKSFMIQHIHAHCRKEMLFDAVTSTTGISSLLINGITLHSYLCLQRGQDSVDQLYKFIVRNKTIRERYQRLQVLIIDEVSMLSAELLDKIDDLMRRMRRSPRVFGGVQIVLLGDFYQLPVVNAEEHFVFESSKWGSYKFETVCLTEIVRQKDETWIGILNNIREGKIVKEDMDMLSTRIRDPPEDCSVIPTILYPTNDQVDAENNRHLERLKEKYRGTRNAIKSDGIYKCKSNAKRVARDTMVSKFPSYLETMELTLECQVMFIINSKDEGIANGTRGAVVGFTENGGHPIVELVDGRRITVQPHTFQVEVDTSVVTLTQYPLKLAWAITIHKSQGLTLDRVQADLGSLVFAYGQVYVALSRVKNLEGLYLIDFDPSGVQANPVVKKFYEKDKINVSK